MDLADPNSKRRKQDNWDEDSGGGDYSDEETGTRRQGRQKNRQV